MKVFEFFLPKVLILISFTISPSHLFPLRNKKTENPEQTLSLPDGAYLSVKEALRLQTELLPVVQLVHHLLQSQELDGTHRPPVPAEDTNLQLSRLSTVRRERNLNEHKQ